MWFQSERPFRPKADFSRKQKVGRGPRRFCGGGACEAGVGGALGKGGGAVRDGVGGAVGGEGPVRLEWEGPWGKRRGCEA